MFVKLCKVVRPSVRSAEFICKFFKSPQKSHSAGFLLFHTPLEFTFFRNLLNDLLRHTFATIITLNNGVPIESVSKMLGEISFIIICPRLFPVRKSFYSLIHFQILLIFSPMIPHCNLRQYLSISHYFKFYFIKSNSTFK